MGGTELVYNLLAECQVGDWHEGLCVSPERQVATLIHLSKLPNLILDSRAAEVGDVMRAIGTAMLVKGALTVVTFGIKLPAGIFIPTLG